MTAMPMLSTVSRGKRVLQVEDDISIPDASRWVIPAVDSLRHPVPVVDCGACGFRDAARPHSVPAGTSDRAWPSSTAITLRLARSGAVGAVSGPPMIPAHGVRSDACRNLRLRGMVAACGMRLRFRVLQSVRTECALPPKWSWLTEEGRLADVVFPARQFDRHRAGFGCVPAGSRRPARRRNPSSRVLPACRG